MTPASQENSRKKIIEAIQQQQNHWTVDSLSIGILEGNITALSAAITFSESTRKIDRALIDEVIEQVMQRPNNTYRIGITGVPGVGKSTLIEQLGLEWIQRGHKVAVLAIDPTSPITQGSILGDKTRMEQLSLNTNAFIRPSPSSLSLGGVTAHTHEAILLCEAAGFDRIIVETVGVGQSEIAVHHLTDCFLLLMLAGAGDQLQGIKRGIMEMCDVLAITKADEQNTTHANKAQAEYQQALHLFPAREDGWYPQVLTTSALSKSGVNELIETLETYLQWSLARGFDNRRLSQKKHLLEQTWWLHLKMQFANDAAFQEKWKSVEEQVLHQHISLAKAISMLGKE